MIIAFSATELFLQAKRISYLVPFDEKLNGTRHTARIQLWEAADDGSGLPYQQNNKSRAPTEWVHREKG